MNHHNTFITGCNFPVTAVLLFLIFVSSIYGFIRRKYFYRMVLHPYSIVNKKQYWRLLSADLVHNDWVHLVFNGAMFYVFGAGLEEELRKKSAQGSWQFLIIYLCSLLGGSIATTIRHRKDFMYSSAGASGSITGCLFSFVLIDPNFESFFVPGIGAVKNIYAGLIYILALMAYQKRKGSEVNYGLHLYGALGGLAATLCLFPPHW